MAKQAQATDAPVERIALEWSAHPAAQRPVVTAMVFLMIPVAGMAAYQYLGSGGFAFIACAVLTVALLPFLLRTRYTLAETVLRVDTALYHFERELTAFRAFEVDASRVWLCTLSRSSRLDNYRGMLVHLDGNSEQVRAALEAVGLTERKRGARAR